MKISVITVCYNSAKTISDTIRSVRAQTHVDLEYIIIDGSSCDNTLQIIASEEPELAKLVSEKDGGIYHAMNKGIAMATGEIIGFINADDLYASPTVLAKVAAVFTDRKIESCYGDLCYVRKGDTSSIVRYWKSSVFQSRSFEVGWCPPHPTFFVRNEIYQRYGLFDLSYKIAADVELMMRFLEVHKVSVKYIPEVLVKMRIGGTTNSSRINIIKQNYEILRALKFHGLRSSFVRLILNKFISRGVQFLVRPNKGLIDE